MKDHVIRVAIGSTDEVKVKEYLKKAEKEFSVSKGVLDARYIRFKSKKKFVKRMKKDLNLVVDSVYYTFGELKG